MSTDSAPEDMSPAQCVSMAADAVIAGADVDVIINIDDDCASCGCCASGGLQYLYWFFMCCENEPE